MLLVQCWIHLYATDFQWLQTPIALSPDQGAYVNVLGGYLILILFVHQLHLQPYLS